MASINYTAKNYLKTHEDGAAVPIKPLDQLRRSVMACLLWEDQFYEDGVSIAERIASLVPQVSEDEARSVLRDAKFGSKLRHIPLYLLVLFARQKWLKKEDVYEICTRSDDMTEILALYFMDGKKPLSHQLTKGLALAFGKFDEYQLAKYNRKKEIKLKDVLRLVRPTPKDDAQSRLWKRLVSGELETPDTWETAISACGGDAVKKTAEYTRLLKENKLGDLAFLRNLRNMSSAGVPGDLIRRSFENRAWKWIIPYQFITAAVYNPALEDALEAAMYKCIGAEEPITQTAALLVDVSGSMYSNLSKKSDTRQIDAAVGIAILLREICSDVRIYTFDDKLKPMPPRRGFALRDCIMNRAGGGTNMWGAIRAAGEQRQNDIMIVVTDEQTADSGNVHDACAGLLVIVNVASFQNGVGYGKDVLHIDGWSDNVIAYLREYLKTNL